MPRSGRLVLVVGPSGAGKDTVLREARRHLGHAPDIVFPRRVITRPPDPAEDHEPVSDDEFQRRAFALSWSAHGLSYGIPASIVGDLDAGRIVVVNVSRAIVADARRRFPCFVVAVTAAPAILAARLAVRRRETAAEIGARLARAAAPVEADAVVANETTPEAAGAAFLGILLRCRDLPCLP
ncbi:phosphonate metabolism protein/1,5-bisphosphokinase (PRPP-forming) PhnN [Acidiphilium sp. JA12-A1]|uniref:phosphonate metabolism protein/1,5-bisphosphokinase (PRPP-forming) PhnN n=1 Tax=Acidiphilium sp. JA12-A1 TaxID=1464546 RepID=UPI000460E5F4|nr:phosphonate metabolism protein/1,5-bisphosphokinase (PRPP-forming) PhnN [Acidiphilium sp. JA12-A1]KDM66934.1 ribose 1,5-bisphosphate phosphokinase PhnN [Acidiphilium sp. JA12-A1]